MNEAKIIKKKLISNIIIYFIIFTCIFSVFGIIIFDSLKRDIYKSSDMELVNAGKNVEKYGALKKTINNKSPETLEGLEIPEVPENMRGEFIGVNPRITYILRDEQGEIINEKSIGRFYDEYNSYLKFYKSDLNSIYQIQVNGYNYRGINYKIENENGQIYYVQLIINVDAETDIINNYFHTLSLGIIITILLSLLASYALSKRTLKPIIESWKKQTEFVQNASHELRTPLTIIQAKQELLLQEPDSKIIDKSEDITLTLNEVKRLTKLTRDLMILANADSKEIIVNKESTNIDELIKQVSKPYIEFDGLENKDIKLNLKYEKNIKIDPNRIHQLLVILLDNAIKYTEQGDTIEINTYSKDNKFVLEVKDTGIGISDKAINHIFDRFYREDKARSRQTGGSGLGLSIANLIVTLHNGTIKASHNKPKGTIFTVKISKYERYIHIIGLQKTKNMIKYNMKNTKLIY